MKKTFVAALVSLAFLLGACGYGNSQSESSEQSSNLHPSGSQAGVASTSETVSVNTAGAADNAEEAATRNATPADSDYVGSNDAHVSNTYITIEIPDVYKQLFDYSSHSLEEGGEAISFYEAADYEDGNGGTLFSINTYPQTYNYSYLPHYEDLGTLTATDGTVWYLVLVYPTETNYTKDHEGTYNYLIDNVEALTDGISAEDGYTLTK